jgi:hypothetical protein
MTWGTVGTVACKGVTTLPFQDQDSTRADVLDSEDLWPSSRVQGISKISEIDEITDVKIKNLGKIRT